MRDSTICLKGPVVSNLSRYQLVVVPGCPLSGMVNIQHSLSVQRFACLFSARFHRQAPGRSWQVVGTSWPQNYNAGSWLGTKTCKQIAIAARSIRSASLRPLLRTPPSVLGRCTKVIQVAFWWRALILFNYFWTSFTKTTNRTSSRFISPK